MKLCRCPRSVSLLASRHPPHRSPCSHPHHHASRCMPLVRRSCRRRAPTRLSLSAEADVSSLASSLLQRHHCSPYSASLSLPPLLVRLFTVHPFRVGPLATAGHSLTRSRSSPLAACCLRSHSSLRPPCVAGFVLIAARSPVPPTGLLTDSGPRHSSLSARAPRSHPAGLLRDPGPCHRVFAACCSRSRSPSPESFLRSGPRFSIGTPNSSARTLCVHASGLAVVAASAFT